jgi:hypothetical protein
MMPDSFTIRKYNQLLKDFHVKNEQQLLEKLEKDSLTLPCQVCGKEISISIVHFLDGDPICFNCLGSCDD